MNKKAIFILSIITVLIMSVNIFADEIYGRIEAEKVNVNLVLKEMENSELVAEYRDIISLIKYEGNYYVSVDNLSRFVGIDYSYDDGDNEIILEKNKEVIDVSDCNCENSNELTVGKSRIVEFKLNEDICLDCGDIIDDVYNEATTGKSSEPSSSENEDSYLSVFEQGIINVSIDGITDEDKIGTIANEFIQKLSLNIGEIESIRNTEAAYRSVQVFDDNDISDEAVGIIRIYYLLNNSDRNEIIKSQLSNYNIIEYKFGTDMIQVAYNIKLRKPDMDERRAKKLENRPVQGNMSGNSNRIIHNEDR